MPATTTAASDEKNAELRKVSLLVLVLPVQVQYCASSSGASQGPVSCQMSESGNCGHGQAQLQGVEEQFYLVAANRSNKFVDLPSVAGMARPLVSDLSPTNSERQVVNYERQRKTLNEKIAATSDEVVKSKLTKRLQEAQQQQNRIQ